MRFRVLAVAMVMSGACARPVAPDAGPKVLPTVFGGARPVTLSVPRGYDPSRPAPLLVLLHGYGNTGQEFERYTGFGPLVDAHGVLVVSPDGTEDSEGNRFWNAGSAGSNRRGTDAR